MWGGAIWSYRTNEDLQRDNGEGLGGVLAVVIYLLLSPVLMFTIPNEIDKMYQRDGRKSPESALLGLWFLLPLIGEIIWYLKVQRALTSSGCRMARSPRSEHCHRTALVVTLREHIRRRLSCVLTQNE